MTFLLFLLWKPNSVMCHSSVRPIPQPVAAELCLTSVQVSGYEPASCAPQGSTCFSSTLQVGVRFLPPSLGLGLPCRTAFCLFHREGSWKQVCLLPASQQHPVTMCTTEGGCPMASALLPISCEPLRRPVEKIGEQVPRALKGEVPRNAKLSCKPTFTL